MNKQIAKMVVIGAVSAALLAGCSSSGATRAMYDWEPGTTSNYEIVQTQAQVLEIPGQGTQENESSSTINMSVVATGPHAFDVTVVDADATGSPVSIEPLIGLESSVELDERGEITTATGLDGNTFIDSMGGPDVFQESLQALFQILSAEPMAPGLEWERSSTTPIERMGMELTREMTESYTCTERTMYEGTDAFSISLESDISMNGSGNQGGQDFDFSVEGTITGTAFIEAGSGRLLHSEQSGALVGIIGMAQASLPITLDLSTSTSLTE